jgi:hypothetical protein
MQNICFEGIRALVGFIERYTWVREWFGVKWKLHECWSVKYTPRSQKHFRMRLYGIGTRPRRGIGMEYYNQ